MTIDRKFSGASAILAISLILMGCATTADKHAAWASQETPYSWRSGAVWTFVFLDRHYRLIRSLTVRITEETANSCSSGEWKRLEILHDEFSRSVEFPGPQGDPAYSIEGVALDIGFTLTECDDNHDVRGELTDTGFTGVYEIGDMLSSATVGPVYGAFAASATP